MTPHKSKTLDDLRWMHLNACAAHVYSMHGVVGHLAGLIAPCFGINAIDVFLPTGMLPVSQAAQVLCYVLHVRERVALADIEERILPHKARWSYGKAAIARVRRKLEEGDEPTRRAVDECAVFIALHYPDGLPNLFTPKYILNQAKNTIP